MGNQKLKWTAEEEEALLAGIEKHGRSKWKTILRDPEFSDQLKNRSNIDLKDKWRNMSPTIAKDIPSAASSDLSIDDTFNIESDTKNAPRYDWMIFEAISTLANTNGSDLGSIFGFIEPRHEVPTNFRRFLSSRLRRLSIQGKLLKSTSVKPLQNLYKIPDPTRTRTPPPPAPPPSSKPKEIKPRQANNQTPRVSYEMVQAAAITAAFKVVEAENQIEVAKVAEEEWEKMNKLAQESEQLLELAKEMHERCSNGEVWVLA